jgi:hypothetical protein
MTFTELLAKIFGSTAHKSVTFSSDSGMTFVGYEADEVMEMLQMMKSDAGDAAHWTGTE